MSASFSYLGEDGVLILTDGAAYDDDGILRVIERKIGVSAKVPVAVTSRGDRDIGDLLAGKIIEAVETWGFDEGLRVVERAFHQWRDALGNLKDRFTEILVAGISESDGPQHFVTTTGVNPDYRPFVWSDPGRQYCGFNGDRGKPGTFTLNGIGLRNPLPGETPIEFFSTVGVGMFEHFRRAVQPGRGYCVGGHIDMTLVRSTGVEVTRIHTWLEDKIGEKINPFASQHVTPIAAGMNRQQRRAAMKQHAA